MKYFVVLILTVISSSSISHAADFNAADPSTWNERHKIAARLEYCGWVMKIICPHNMGIKTNPFEEKKHECPNFTPKYYLAESLIFDRASKQLLENSKIVYLLRKDLEGAAKMGTLDIPLSAYDNCQNDVEEFLADNYKPTFDLKSFND